MYFNTDDFKPNTGVELDLYVTIAKMCPEKATRVKIEQQLEKLKRAQGLFGMEVAIETRVKKQLGNSYCNNLYF